MSCANYRRLRCGCVSFVNPNEKLRLASDASLVRLRRRSVRRRPSRRTDCRNLLVAREKSARRRPCINFSGCSSLRRESHSVCALSASDLVKTAAVRVVKIENIYVRMRNARDWSRASKDNLPPFGRVFSPSIPPKLNAPISCCC